MVPEFQFLYGTIGSATSGGTSQAAEIFQFLYGTIGRNAVPDLPLIIVFISIPIWYDWKLYQSIPHLHHLQISIPIWYDWKTSLSNNTEALNVFQFLYGTIGSFLNIIPCTFLIYISIPIWYDWKILSHINTVQFYFHFNSYMVRLEV